MGIPNVKNTIGRNPSHQGHSDGGGKLSLPGVYSWTRATAQPIFPYFGHELFHVVSKVFRYILYYIMNLNCCDVRAL